MYMDGKKTMSLNNMYNKSADFWGTLPEVYYKDEIHNKTGGMIWGSFPFIRLTFSFLPKTYTPFSTL